MELEYSSADISLSNWATLSNLALNNHPPACGSVLASVGSATTASLISIISPLIGEYKSEAAFTDSTTPIVSLKATVNHLITLVHDA